MNNSKAAAKRTQVVYSEPRKTFVGKKTVKTKSGKEIVVGIYKRNKNAKPVRMIVHPLPPPTSTPTSPEAKTMGLVTTAPILSAYQQERNQRRADEREANRNRPQLIVSGETFRGSIRATFTGPNRNNIV